MTDGLISEELHAWGAFRTKSAIEGKRADAGELRR